MKRTLSLALCLILSLALLAGCGAAPLPDGLTQESVTDAAAQTVAQLNDEDYCLLYTSPSPRDLSTSRMPSSA